MHIAHRLDGSRSSRAVSPRVEGPAQKTGGNGIDAPSATTNKLEGPLKLCVESCAFVVGEHSIVSLPPGELKTYAKGSVNVPE